MFVTSKTCRDLSPEQAKDYILGYTVGNDLSCRKFQMPSNSGGQFFFAKAFDKFAPIGPTLMSPQLFANGINKMVTKVNGKVVQTADFKTDMIFSAEKILSHMSQGIIIKLYMNTKESANDCIAHRNDYSCWHSGHDGDTSRCWRFPQAKTVPPRRRCSRSRDGPGRDTSK